MGMVLENPAVSGILVYDQLRIRDAAGQVMAVHCRNHDVIVAIGDQNREIYLSKILRRLIAPCGDGFQLAQEDTERRLLVAVLAALLQPIQKVSCSATPVVR